MANEDADDSRARSEQGRKNNDFNDFFQSVNLDIKEQADAGLNKTVYTVSPRDVEFVEVVSERLSDREYDVSYDEDSRKLQISWPEPESFED